MQHHPNVTTCSMFPDQHQHHQYHIACSVHACYRYAKVRGMCLVHASSFHRVTATTQADTSPLPSVGSLSPSTSTSSTLSAQDEAASATMFNLAMLRPRSSSLRPRDVADDDSTDGHHHHNLTKSSRRCFIANCDKYARIAGLCTQHNMKLSNQRRKCNVDGCPSYARTAGLCIRHGGGKTCSVDGCVTVQQSGGLCRAHGGGSKCKPCKYTGCTHFARVGGLCGQHKNQPIDPDGRLPPSPNAMLGVFY
ncbi:hypothetical protein H257_01646 [Aphanomyces astaci]|uniref:WRKY19-like zinc finger domain-containing protein n=1 Tax=Aphanomyces astaci TaxID=112090 RepID=W4H347_APHAT|nr:hypothetical protein H257_01646 [Aphanomyces astaci]ETV86450.1 hypothetical protein H257_01646 [Aphanomyces astaci]|eukprot:XP_009823249.1 hypothetical protein H257_01646 [Aphanomyces astaci]